MTTRVDIFTNVHKGLRRGLFAACEALGRASGELGQTREARALLVEVLRFVAHHGENEDRLLVPMLEGRAAAACERMRSEHAAMEPVLQALIGDAATVALEQLYPRTCEFVARYLDHMHVEEQILEPMIRAALSEEELASFGRRSVERTAPADQRMMLGWMLPAMTPSEALGLLARLPEPLAAELRPLVP